MRVVSPTTFQLQRVVHVRYKDAPLYQLNELEYVNGDLLANVYQSDWVLRIDPVTGVVRQLFDFAELYPDRPGSHASRFLGLLRPCWRNQTHPSECLRPDLSV